MSNNETSKIIDNIKQIPKLYFLIFIVVLLILLVSLISFTIGKNTNNLANSPIPVVSISSGPTNNIDNQNILGVSIKNWIGTITNINSNEIYINTSEDESEMVIITNDNTIYNKIDLTKPNRIDDNYSNIENISKNELAIGQQIMVKSNTYQNGDKVNATEINLLITL